MPNVKKKTKLDYYNELLAYLKEEGFWRSDKYRKKNCYYAPTCFLPENIENNRSSSIHNKFQEFYLDVSSYSKIYVTIYSPNIIVQDSNKTISQVMSMSADYGNNLGVYSLNEEGLTKFKNYWLNYKNNFKQELTDFKQRIEEVKAKLDSAVTFFNSEVKKNLIAKGYKFDPNIHKFIKEVPLNDDVLLNCNIRFYRHLRYEKSGVEKYFYDCFFTIYFNKLNMYWLVNDPFPTKLVSSELRSIISKLGLTQEIILNLLQAKLELTDYKEADKYIEDKIKQIKEAIQDEEIQFDGKESLSINEALRILRRTK